MHPSAGSQEGSRWRSTGCRCGLPTSFLRSPRWRTGRNRARATSRWILRTSRAPVKSGFRTIWRRVGAMSLRAPLRQESSTRYIAMDPANIPGAGEIGIPDDLAPRWRDVLARAFAAYNSEYARLDALAAAHPDRVRLPTDAKPAVA